MRDSPSRELRERVWEASEAGFLFFLSFFLGRVETGVYEARLVTELLKIAGPIITRSHVNEPGRLEPAGFSFFFSLFFFFGRNKWRFIYEKFNK